MGENSTFQSRNPVFRGELFRKASEDVVASGEVMTINGTIKKSFIALLVLLSGAAFSWVRMGNCSLDVLGGRLLLFSILALVVYFVAVFRPDTARITVPLYALLEGFMIGSISWLMEKAIPGIVTQALMATVGVLAVMLLVYKTGIIRPTEKFTIVLVAATAAICLTYVIDLLMMCFGGSGFGFINSASPVSIAFSVVVCIIAALSLILDFEYIRRQSESNVPEQMEWLGALGLLVTLIWIYLEILRLLVKLNNRRN